MKDQVNVKSLKRKSVRGGGLTLVSQGAKVLVQLTSTVVLARLLSPEEFGLVAMVIAVTTFAGIFRDLGLSAAAIQRKDLTADQQSNLFWLNIIVGAILTLLISAISPLVVWFYGREELLWVTIALSLNFVISSVGAQHSAHIIREMKFGTKAAIDIIVALVTLVGTVFFAYIGLSYWALVWGRLIGAALNVLLFCCFSGFRPSLPSMGTEMRELINFGAHVTSSGFINYFSRNLDNVLIGKFIGAEALGVYGRAYQLMMFPIINLRAPIQAVAFPAMSRLEPTSDDFRAYYSQIVRVLAWLTMPAMMCIFLCASDLVHIVLGESWAAVVPIISTLALVGFIQPVSSLRGLVMLSAGYVKRQLKANLFTAIIVCIAFLIGLKWGTVGVAGAYAAAVFLIAIPMHVYCCSGTAVTLSDFIVPLISPLLASGSSYFLYQIVIIFLGRVPNSSLIALPVVMLCALLVLSFDRASRQLVVKVCVLFFNKKAT